MIDKNKQYETRSGIEARIYATDAGGDYPVHGAVLINGRWITEEWTLEGMNYIPEPNSPYDLIEAGPRIKREYWVNVYEGRVGEHYESKEIADKCASTIGRIACVKIEIDCEEGEGLNESERTRHD